MKKSKLPALIVVSLSAVLSINCKKGSYGNPTPDSSGSNEKKWVVTTLAGDGFASFKDGPALTARFRAPADVAVTPEGIVFVADAINHRIRRIADGVVSTFAGSARQDTISGIGTSAMFELPIQIVSDKNGNLYTLDVDDYRVRKIAPNAEVTVVAGNGTRGFADGAANIAEFGECAGIAVDEQGNIYVSDEENNRIRKISTTGDVTTLAGPTSFASLGGITIDPQGNLFVVDREAHVIKKVSPAGEVSVFTGSGTPGDRDGTASEAQFSSDMNDLVIDDQNNLYLTDGQRIRKITPQGLVSTIAGSTYGYLDGIGTSAKFGGPFGLGIDSDGKIYIADDFNNRIRKLSFE